MASEDSDQLLSGFPMVHRLSEHGNLNQSLAGEMPVFANDFHTPRELLEVIARFEVRS
jgi:hypothetical protein